MPAGRPRNVRAHPIHPMRQAEYDKLRNLLVEKWTAPGDLDTVAIEQIQRQFRKMLTMDGFR